MMVNTCFVRPLISFALFVVAFVVFDHNALAFRAHLYQRESYGSPFYDPTLSETDIIRRAVARSRSHVNNKRLSSSPPHNNNTSADLFGQAGEYYMSIRVGTPPTHVVVVADTGSGLTWIQCEPCRQCLPSIIFNPKSSKSYSKIRCGPSKPAANCPSGSFSQCKADGLCHYNIPAAANSNESTSIGLLSTDTVRIDSSLISQPASINVSHYIFGCGTYNESPFGSASAGASGVVGLGAGPQSLIKQLGPITKGRFSYCLTSFGSQVTSHIHFGEDAVVLPASGTITIPLANPEKIGEQEGPYLATLEAFTIGKTRIPFTNSSSSSSSSSSVHEEAAGNIAIVTSSALTKLPRPYYHRIVDAVVKEIGVQPYIGPGRLVDLCYNNKDLQSPLPNIVANFKGGDVPLPEKNVFSKVVPLTCFLFGPSDSSYAVFGSIAQHNFQVGFDTVAGTVSFKPFDCTTA